MRRLLIGLGVLAVVTIPNACEPPGWDGGSGADVQLIAYPGPCGSCGPRECCPK